jgi:hypothetical protein
MTTRLIDLGGGVAKLDTESGKDVLTIYILGGAVQIKGKESLAKLRDALNGAFPVEHAPNAVQAELNTLKKWSAEHLGCDHWKKDAERYRRIRENWIDCVELGLHGRLAVIDTAIDAAIKERQPKPSGRIEVTQEMVDRMKKQLQIFAINQEAVFDIRAMLEYVLGEGK